MRSLARITCVMIMLGLTTCSTDVAGNFAWATTDDRGVQEPERSLLLPTDFRVEREHLYFYNHETIWWIYQITGGYYDEEMFLAALYEDNLTPDPVLVDLRRVRLQEDDCCHYIRQSYEQLAPGRYLLKIAYESIAVDQVHFEVVLPEGPGYRESEMDLEDEVDSELSDDISRYSS